MSEALAFTLIAPATVEPPAGALTETEGSSVSGAAVPFARALHPLLDDREKLLALRERSASIAHRFSVTRMVEEYETLGALLARS